MAIAAMATRFCACMAANARSSDCASRTRCARSSWMCKPPSCGAQFPDEGRNGVTRRRTGTAAPANGNRRRRVEHVHLPSL
eukprot:3459813-Pyramimonas_sp.AAC.1